MSPPANIDIRRLSSCSFDDALRAWNEGFQGYFVDMTLSLDGYLARVQGGGLSPAYSFMAFCEGQPAGFLLNGVRTIGEQRVAWNGGTGVTPEHRGRGVAKALLRATVALYLEQNVSFATLEAISGNESAISLYCQFGYEISDRLIFLQHEGALNNLSFADSAPGSYAAKPVALPITGALSFYPQLVPWQAQWQSLTLNDGAALVVEDNDGIAVGFALYKKQIDEQGRLANIVLHQCVVDPACAAAEAVVKCALQYLYSPLEVACRRTTHNLGSSSQPARSILLESGFTPFIEQVHMVRASAGS